MNQLEAATWAWDAVNMKTTTIDSEHRAHIPGAPPNQKYWIIENDLGFNLLRIPEAESGSRMSREEVIRAIQNCQLTFPRDWEEIREDTREP